MDPRGRGLLQGRPSGVVSGARVAHRLDGRAARYPGDDPEAVSGPVDGQFRPAVAVVVAWHRDVAPGRVAELGDGVGAAGGMADDPLGGAGAEHGEVGLAVAVVVRRGGDVAAG